jgi:hypothetical protein
MGKPSRPPFSQTSPISRDAFNRVFISISNRLTCLSLIPTGPNSHYTNRADTRFWKLVSTLCFSIRLGRSHEDYNLETSQACVLLILLNSKATAWQFAPLLIITKWEELMGIAFWLVKSILQKMTHQECAPAFQIMKRKQSQLSRLSFAPMIPAFIPMGATATKPADSSIDFSHSLVLRVNIQ